VVIGAPVFTFNVEGHASIFEGLNNDFSITDETTCGLPSNQREQILRRMKTALSMLLDCCPYTKKRDAAGRKLPPCAEADDPIYGWLCCKRLRPRLPDDGRVVEEAPSHRRRCTSSWPMRGRTVFTHDRAASAIGCCEVGMASTVPAPHGLPDRRWLGEVSIQALWTAAQRKDER